MAEMVYYKKNVKYVVGGRHFIGDPQGWTLTEAQPYIGIPIEKLRDFKLANRRTITDGLIVLMQEEPSVDFDTVNAITDEEAVTLVKNYLLLKQTLEKVDSYNIVLKLSETAKELDRPQKTIKLIEARLAELEPDEDNFSARESGDE